MEKIEKVKYFIEKKVRRIRQKIWRGIILAFIAIIIIASYMVYINNNGCTKILLNNLFDTIKVSISVLISMLGFSVSIYVFLNNSFQSRRIVNTIEKQIIDKFQSEKAKSLRSAVVFAVVAIICECVIMVSHDYLVGKMFFIIILFFFVIIATIFNIIKLGYFTFDIINYEAGLEKLANIEVGKYSSDSDHGKISKGEFLNLVNNIEVLVDRLIQNHIHAKMSSKDDSDLKQAICDGITEPGELGMREKLAEDYKDIIEYRNLLVQTTHKDSEEVAMGDDIKSIMNRMFQRYIRGELLTGINLSNLEVSEADLEKTSFSNSSFYNITFTGDTNLKFVDFRDSTINKMFFKGNNTLCEGTNFTNSKLIDVEFDVNVRLTRAVFKSSDLTNIKKICPKDKEGDRIEFKHANFSNANMTRLDICMTDFRYSDFSNVRLIDSKIGVSALKGCNIDFSYANMKNADFLRTHLERGLFNNADLERASFTYAYIKDTSFEDARLSELNCTKAAIEKCRFEKSYGTKMSMKSANIKESQFDYAMLNSADMSGATVKGCCFDDAVCTDTLWVDTKIEKTSFRRSVLANARIVGKANERTRIRKCSFKNANLSNVAITNVEFDKCNFKGTDFSDARLINVRFVNCKNIDEANMSDVWIINVYKGKNGKVAFDNVKNKDVRPRYVSNTKRRK